MPVITQAGDQHRARRASHHGALRRGEASSPRARSPLVAGSAGDLLDHLGRAGRLAFTGSSDTGARSAPCAQRRRELGARERRGRQPERARCSGPTSSPAREIWDLFLADVVRDMTQKTGQKCTAIRRVFVPAGRWSTQRARRPRRAPRRDVKVGDPAREDVTHGPGRDGGSSSRTCAPASSGSPRDGRARLRRRRGRRPSASRRGKGFFVPPSSLDGRGAGARGTVHAHEVFGPVATVMPYDGPCAQAAAIVRAAAAASSRPSTRTTRPSPREAVLGTRAVPRPRCSSAATRSPRPVAGPGHRAAAARPRRPGPRRRRRRARRRARPRASTCSAARSKDRGR